MRGLGFSYCVSSGNELDLDLTDYLEFFLDDENTKIIVCLIEGIRRPAAFMAAAARALAIGKPILMVKSGRSERAKEAVMSHTGALAGDDDVFNALCRRYGIVRCRDLDEMLETCLAFAQGRLPKGRRIGLITTSGNSVGLLVDYASEEGAELADFAPATKERLVGLIDPGLVPGNPLDVGATNVRRQDKFAAICKHVVADPNVDMLGVQGQLPILPHEASDPAILADLAAATDKPVLFFARMAQNLTEAARDFGRKTGLPFLQGLPAAVHALQALATYAERRARVRVGVRAGSYRCLPARCSRTARRSTRSLRRMVSRRRAAPWRLPPRMPQRVRPRSAFRSRSSSFRLTCRIRPKQAQSLSASPTVAR